MHFVFGHIPDFKEEFILGESISHVWFSIVTFEIEVYKY